MGFLQELQGLIRALCKAQNMMIEHTVAAVDSIYTCAFRKLGFLIEAVRDSTVLTAKELRRIIAAVQKYCKENPKEAAFVVLCAIIVPCAPIVTAEILQALGFGMAGPLAGSLAARFMSAFGVNPVFSALQSAAMMGYATAAVNLAVTITAATAGVLTAFTSKIWSLCNGERK